MINRRILVISRSPALSRAIQASLGPGYQVVTSTNVIDVIDEVHELGPFDVLVAGPVFDSHAGMARLATLRATAAVPAVVLALGPKPRANLSDIVRTGAVELVEYPTSKRQLSAALLRAFDIADISESGARTDDARRGAWRRRGPAGVRRGVHRGVVERRVRQDVLRHQPGLLPGGADGPTGVPGRPGPAVRRGLHRTAPAAPVHDFGPAVAGARRRGRPRRARRGIPRAARAGLLRAGGAVQPGRCRHDRAQGPLQGDGRAAAALRLHRRRHPGPAVRDRAGGLRPLDQGPVHGHAGPAEHPQHAGVPQHAPEAEDQRRRHRGRAQQGRGGHRYRHQRRPRGARREDHLGASLLEGSHEVDQQGQAGTRVGRQLRHRQEVGREHGAVPLGRDDAGLGIGAHTPETEEPRGFWRIKRKGRTNKVPELERA